MNRARKQMELELEADEVEAIGLTLRAARVVHGASMKQLVKLMALRYGIVCTPSTVWTILTWTAPPGRINWATGRDPGRFAAKGTARHPRRRGERWYTYPKTIGRGL